MMATKGVVRGGMATHASTARREHRRHSSMCMARSARAAATVRSPYPLRTCSPRGANPLLGALIRPVLRPQQPPAPCSWLPHATLATLTKPYPRVGNSGATTRRTGWLAPMGV